MDEPMDSIDIPNLRLALEALQIRRESIVDLWVERDEVRTILDRFGINSEWFIHNYADNILGHFINIIRGTRAPGDCPYMNRMVRFLKERDLMVTDIFTICIGLRRSVRERLFDPDDEDMKLTLENLNQASLCNEINKMFDANLHGVLSMFQGTISLKDRQIQEYMEIVDKNVIISKTDLRGTIIHVSEAFCEVSGYTRKELIGKSHNIVRHPEMPSAFFEELWDTIKSGQVWYGEIKNLRKDGKAYWVEGNIQPLRDRDGNLYGYMALRHDITHTIMMFTDPLTRIHNRLKFEECLDLEISRFDRYRSPFCVILFDIDDFKRINDTHGHKSGDEILVELTGVVKRNIRDSDIFARWGGEEFVILCPGSVQEVHSLAERLRQRIEEFVKASDRSVTCSFGVTSCQEKDTEDSLFTRADRFLYRAKGEGKNRVISDLTGRITEVP